MTPIWGKITESFYEIICESGMIHGIKLWGIKGGFDIIDNNSREIWNESGQVSTKYSKLHSRMCTWKVP
jgi:hypothetical protein